MGTCNPNSKSTYNLLRALRGLRGLIRAVIVGVISTYEPATLSPTSLH